MIKAVQIVSICGIMTVMFGRSKNNPKNQAKVGKQNKRVYLDWAAASPLCREAYEAMQPWLTTEWGNASAIHTEGQRAKAAVEDSREALARSLSIRSSEIIFTASGTEANNLAIFGLALQMRAENRIGADLEIITTRLEHPSVTRVMEELLVRGVIIHFVRVDEYGVIDLEHLQELLNERTALVTFAYANSEIGTIQPVKRITRVVKKFNALHNLQIKVHTDAAQAPLWLTCEPHRLGVDLLSLDAGKCNGPKGVGVLVKLHATNIKSVTRGGGQESGLRAGTENVAGIVGASVAITAAQAEYTLRAERVAAVRDAAIAHMQSEIPQAVLNGPVGEDRIANNIHISIPGLDTEYATVVLDTHGFAVSTKSACSGAGGGESSVVREISGDTTRAASTLRITLGPDTTLQNIKDLTKVLTQHIKKMDTLTPA